MIGTASVQALQVHTTSCTFVVYMQAKIYCCIILLHTIIIAPVCQHSMHTACFTQSWKHFPKLLPSYCTVYRNRRITDTSTT